MRGAPLAVVEAEFVRVAPELVVAGQVYGAPVPAREVDLREVRGVLLRRDCPWEVRDAVWRRVVRSARAASEWMTGALGLAMPALRGAAARATRGLDWHAVEEVEAEVLAAAVAGVRGMDVEHRRLAGVLRDRARRAALSARRGEQERPRPWEAAGLAAGEAREEGHPDFVLAGLVERGVLTEEEASLIARSRLGQEPLGALAAEWGVSYKCVAKRRERAEAKLARALAAQRASAAGEAVPRGAPGGLVEVAGGFSVRPVSNAGGSRAY